MHERVEAEAQEAPAAAAAGTLRQGAVVERMLALQRSAGNAAVNRLLARQPAGQGAIDTTPVDFVFILGAKDDTALDVAKEYYRSVLMSSLTRRVISREEMDDPSLDGVFAYLSQFKYPLREITLVVHGTGNGTLQVPLNQGDDDKETTPDELEQAIKDGVLTPLNDGQITSKTRIRLQACFAGVRSRMVNLLDKAIGEGFGTVIAPTVEVGYAKDIWHSEGLTGWWVTSPKELSADELALALKTKYGASVDHDDAKWAELAQKPEKHPGTAADGTPMFTYIANSLVTSVKPGNEDDPLLYTKSSYYYMPEEL